ncbi:MAG: hypothetical protein ABSA75_13190 [Candidatus Bathyarchaeia archaeon]|jgi:hypothetical protein
MPLDVPAITSHMITTALLAGIVYLAGYIVLKLTRNNNPSKVKAYATVGFVGAFFSFGWFFGWGIYNDIILGLRIRGLPESFIFALNSGNLIFMLGCIPTVILFFRAAHGKTLAVPQLQVAKASRQITPIPERSQVNVKTKTIEPVRDTKFTVQEPIASQPSKSVPPTQTAPTHTVSPPLLVIDSILKDLKAVLIDTGSGGPPLVVYIPKEPIGSNSAPTAPTEEKKEDPKAETVPTVETQRAVETPVAETATTTEEEQEPQRKSPPESKYCHHC